MSADANLGLIWKIHNATCPIWLSRIGVLRNLEPGCKAVLKRLSK